MTQAGLDARLYLLRMNRSAVMVMLAKALRTGLDVEGVAAIVADTRDTVGGPMARAMAERSAELDPDAEAGRAAAKNEIPTLVAVVPLKLAVTLFAYSHRTVSDGLPHPTAGVRLTATSLMRVFLAWLMLVRLTCFVVQPVADGPPAEGTGPNNEGLPPPDGAPPPERDEKAI
jgi:hypothetical protein